MYADSEVYRHTARLYTGTVRGFHVGDVIRKARDERHWNQKQLGVQAVYYPLGDQVEPIDKGTVSKVERDPYGSKFGTIWRLLAALDLTLADAEQQIGVLRRKEEKRRATIAREQR